MPICIPHRYVPVLRKGGYSYFFCFLPLLYSYTVWEYHMFECFLWYFYYFWGKLNLFLPKHCTVFLRRISCHTWTAWPKHRVCIHLTYDTVILHQYVEQLFAVYVKVICRYQKFDRSYIYISYTSFLDKP